MPKVKKSPGEKKKKAKKDPNAPKRALSAFMIFSQEKRAAVKDENPDATFGQLGKLLGEAWKNLSDKEKAPYITKADAAKEKYKKEVAAYNAQKASASADEEEEEIEEEE